jgi:hypothetical protein
MGNSCEGLEGKKAFLVAHYGFLVESSCLAISTETRNEPRGSSQKNEIIEV